MAEIYIKQLRLGPMHNFGYLVGDPQTQQAAVIDPAWEVEPLFETAKADGYTFSAIWITHGHPDHMNGLPDFLKKHNVPVYISQQELALFKPVGLNVIEVADQAQIKLGSLIVTGIHTPGHTPGGMCYKVGPNLFTGDTLFINCCGRCDLPGSDPRAMYHSLYNKLLRLPEDTIIYPGHAYHRLKSATLKEVKALNPSLQCTSLQDFLAC